MIRTFKKFFSFCREEDRRKFYIAIFVGILTSIMGAMRIPAFGISVQDALENRLSERTILIVLMILGISFVITVISKMATTMLQTDGGYSTCSYKRIEMAEKLRYLPMGYYNDNSLGKITAVVTTTMDGLANVATRVVLLVTEGITTSFIITVFIFFYDPVIGAICLLGNILFLLSNSIMIKVSENVAVSKNSAVQKLTGAVLSYVLGIMEVKNYDLVGDTLKNLDAAISEKEQADFLERKILPSLCLQKIIIKLTGVGVCAASIIRYLDGEMSLDYAIVFLASSFMIYEALDTVGTYSGLLRSVDHAVNQAEEVLSLKGMNTDGEDVTPENHDIVLDNVHFSYEDNEIIQGVSLKIPQNSMTAIIGPSGSGKTTLAKLIARFWDVDSGAICLGGHDIRTMSYDSLIRNFSFVFQNVYLFEDTIANNIRFGVPEASMAQVIEAAKKACCHEFISALPNGYDTIVGERGANLSGGEKQRISIARAIMKDAPVIILDEATANVDPENEAELTKAIEALTARKTVIMIAHRLKTVRNASQIIVVDKGRIVQQGTHEELIRQDGIYRNFINERKKASGWKIS